MFLERYPKGLQDKPLNIELSKIVELIFDDLSLLLKKAENKYTDVNLLTKEELQELIQESGFQYILNVLVLTDEQTRNLFQFISLIHLLKGQRKGLELVLKFLNLDFDIVEWWEADPPSTPATFSLVIQFSEQLGGAAGIQRLEDFMKHYVYPVFVLSVDLLGDFTRDDDLGIDRPTQMSMVSAYMHFEGSNPSVTNYYSSQKYGTQRIEYEGHAYP